MRNSLNSRERERYRGGLGRKGTSNAKSGMVLTGIRILVRILLFLSRTHETRARISVRAESGFKADLPLPRRNEPRWSPQPVLRPMHERGNRRNGHGTVGTLE